MNDQVSDQRSPRPHLPYGVGFAMTPGRGVPWVNGVAPQTMDDLRRRSNLLRRTLGVIGRMQLRLRVSS